jgi:hypothetical protein
MNPDETSPWVQIVAKAWADETFKNRLLSNPSAVFQEVGLEVPQGLQVRVVENTDQILHFTLPAKPREGELSDAELAGVSGGFSSLVAYYMAVKGMSASQAEEYKAGMGGMSPQQQAAAVAAGKKLAGIQ